MDRNDLRVGDAEREQTMAALREHFAQGRLTHEELDERLDAALAARTAGDLARVTNDLPGHQPGHQPAHREPFSPYGMDDWRAAVHAHRRQVQSMRDLRRDMRGDIQRAAWAARHAHLRGQAGRRRGPHPILPLLFVLMMIGLVIGGFGVFKVLFVVWLGAMLFSLARRRLHHRG
ncbi:DUF1707 SHOCT-like domain-containing protein [Nonomuraea candida]|uniref:DUF1707 SHOCT-like domain-containing protein n=1 Tax=Nonomuraea candida TaxID=359159 RepID=UPI000694D40F|nr:DUF1707 domain-containing protein [Nonomuraea candida]